MGFLKSTIQDDEEEDISAIKQLNAARCGGGDDNRAWSWSWKIPFQIFATIILSLPLPLSFLLLARLSAVHYPSSVDSSGRYYQFPPVFATLLLIYNGKSIILYSLVAVVTVAAFIHGLTSTPFPLNSGSPTPEQPVSGARHRAAKIYAAWFLIFMFQVYVGVGTEWSRSAGITVSVIAEASSNDVYVFTARALLFVGLLETMSFWSKYVVKPVVEDAVGGGRGGGGHRLVAVAERVCVALTFGALWWFKLRDEVDILILVPELILGPIQRRRDVVVAVAGEFGGWWLYALTSSIGSIRVLKGSIWVVSAVLTSSRRKVDVIETSSDSVPQQNSHHQLPPLEDVV
ncbi:OLC1v1004399C1 [Oldenlandia corymbosa var. corymbosa]|uniref:OLC1v1004399C1 n=1 Tax=Oldenlandia corymbosa var. corymbosa TaxID=529605 RepID=A0AAV1DE62_OLDCO|nr:OLC1v1004399C1 [Oldenlandia corymbosa var. corymbosa]